VVGMAGLGLLRLHRSGDTSTSPAIVDELRQVLPRIGEPPFDADVLGEQLDIVGGYERWATVYDAPGNPVVAHEQPVMWSWLEGLHGEPVLDAACGTGRHLAHLIEGGRSTIGVDMTPAMLAVAAAKAPRADLRAGDLLELPVEDASVAGVVCALALEHLEDLPGAYRELARVVRPRGWVLVSTTHPAIRSILGWGAWFIDAAGRGEVPTYPQTVADHLNAAVDAGLRLVECREPAIDREWAAALAPSDAPIGGAVAMRGVPVVLACRFQRPE